MSGAALTRVEVGIDCADAALLARFWAVALSAEIVDVHGEPEVHDPAGRLPHVWFQPVPEAKTVKNRLHLDLWFADRVAATAHSDTLVAAGATVLRQFGTFWLLADPESNEFCLCWPGEDE